MTSAWIPVTLQTERLLAFLIWIVSFYRVIFGRICLLATYRVQLNKWMLNFKTGSITEEVNVWMSTWSAAAGQRSPEVWVTALTQNGVWWGWSTLVTLEGLVKPWLNMCQILLCSFLFLLYVLVPMRLVWVSGGAFCCFAVFSIERQILQEICSCTTAPWQEYRHNCCWEAVTGLVNRDKLWALTELTDRS